VQGEASKHFTISGTLLLH